VPKSDLFSSMAAGRRRRISAVGGFPDKTIIPQLCTLPCGGDSMGWKLSREVKKRLSDRERDVLKRLVQLFFKLQMTPRAFEVHQARIMEKLGARNLTE